KSGLPKVLHPLAGKPLFLHTLETALRIEPSSIAVIIGHGGEALQRAYSHGNVNWVIQEKQLGTGHAVLCAKESFRDFQGDVVILSGDVSLIREQSLKTMINIQREREALLTLLTDSLEAA